MRAAEKKKAREADATNRAWALAQINKLNKRQVKAFNKARDARFMVVGGGGICVIICLSTATGVDQNGERHDITPVGVGLKIDAGYTLGIESELQSYMNGGSQSLACDAELAVGGYGEVGNGLDDGSWLPEGGGGGLAAGIGGGCAEMWSFTSPGVN
ncbi:MAG TPA: hypothetical protein VGM94_07190 [Galbitalea sp.]